MKENLNLEENVRMEAIILGISFFIVLAILITCIQIFNKEESDKNNKVEENKVIKDVETDIISNISEKEELIAYVPRIKEDKLFETDVTSNSRLLNTSVEGNIIKVLGTARYEEIDGNKLNFVDIRVNLKNVDIDNLTIYLGGSEVDVNDILIKENDNYFFDYIDVIHGVNDQADIVIVYKNEVIKYYINSSSVKPLKVVEEESVKNCISVPKESEKDLIVGGQELTYDFTLLEVDNSVTTISEEIKNENEKNYVLKFDGVVNYYEDGVMDIVGLGEYNNIVVVKLFAPDNFGEEDLKKVVLEVSNPSGEVDTYNEFDYDGIDADSNRYYKYIYNAVDTEEVPYFTVDWDGEEDNYEKEVYTYDISDVVLEMNENMEESVQA